MGDVLKDLFKINAEAMRIGRQEGFDEAREMAATIARQVFRSRSRSLNKEGRNSGLRPRYEAAARAAREIREKIRAMKPKAEQEAE